MFSIRIKIWHKLFFAILLVVMLVLAISMVLSRLSFQQGFTQYIEEVKLKRLDGFRLALSEQYREQKSWAFLQENPRLWHQLLVESNMLPPRLPRGPDGPGFGRRGAGPRGGGPPSELAAADERHPPSPPRFMRERLGLLDAARAQVIGPPPTTKHRLLPIQLERQVVGYLTLRIFTPRRTELDQQFEQQQFDNLLLTALLSLLIAIIAALLLARLFVRPISGIAKMARQLTAGQFEVRIEKIRRDELGDLAADLNTLVETLEQNQRSRRQWIADISHELRTPLTVLRGELEAMEDGVRPLNRESIQSLSLEVKQLKRLVDDLYQLSLSDQGSLSYEKERVLPLELLRGVAEGFIVTMQQRQIILTVGCEGEGPHLLADPQRLTQLFTNLLENSQRYTDEGGEVKVHCEVGSSLLIHFEDSAPGVPPELIPRIFERLFRVEGSRNRDHGGSGLGLSIVQSIAKAHGGELRAEPSSLGGLTITLQLPIDPKR
ncbi:MAG: HAMP domain-containing protein [Gammaproteobacteria bacterium]|jgi:two-component system sensor histidine kinase BaeS|nr:HAMP domain-containing protein [Gammaproteobacteria bacterium]MBT4605450.1 HAMP domain-containing protein [Thiotrichales bacterium]MBT3473403.1 HAMP domain-containing protein [Gammaproteobacteria bacterium]MBT3967460.1 HAMP domain-containing protein [Gammaproteobacteria bacterium]MBT4080862.1 HAMP domain-containing protein [Gammaproteobacteria bacterium]